MLLSSAPPDLLADLASTKNLEISDSFHRKVFGVQQRATIYYQTLFFLFSFFLGVRQGGEG